MYECQSTKLDRRRLYVLKKIIRIRHVVGHRGVPLNWWIAVSAQTMFQLKRHLGLEQSQSSLVRVAPMTLCQFGEWMKLGCLGSCPQ